MRKFKEICLVVLLGFILALTTASAARDCPPKKDKGVMEGVGNTGETAGSNVDRNANTRKQSDQPLSPQQVAQDQARARERAEADERAARKAEEEKEAQQRAIDDAVAQALARQRKPETEAEKRADKPETQAPPVPPEPTEPKEPQEPSEPSETSGTKGPDSGISGSRTDKDIADRFRGREERRSRDVGDRTQGDFGRTFAGGGDRHKTSGGLTAKVDSDLEKLEKEQKEKEERRRRGHGPITEKPSPGGTKTTGSPPSTPAGPATPSFPDPSQPRSPKSISIKDSSGNFAIVFQFPNGEGNTSQSTKIKDGTYTYDVVQIIMDEKISYYEASVNISVSGKALKGWRMYIRSNLWDRGPQARTRIENPSKLVLKRGYYYQIEIDYNETLKVTRKDGTKEDQIVERTSLTIFQLKKATK